MPASSLNFAPTKIKAGSIGYLWTGVAIPAAGARISLTANADGIMTPDSTANPNAKHVGLTRAGAMARIVPSYESYMADEYAAPVKTMMSGLESTIDAELLQVFDLDALKVATSGFGTYATGTGYDEISLGIGAQAYTGVVLLFPTEADSTKYCVVHLYKAYNAAGIDSLGSARRDMAGLKVSFRGISVTSRAATDTDGKIWIQT